MTTEPTFFIDRQFGQAIFLVVENGIFKNCVNAETNFGKGLEKVYSGKSITFFKQDFEEKMKGSYHCVKHLELTNLFQKRSAIETRINFIEGCVRARGCDAEMTDAELNTVKGLLKEIKDIKTDIEVLKKELQEVHGFVTN